MMVKRLAQIKKYLSLNPKFSCRFDNIIFLFIICLIISIQCSIFADNRGTVSALFLDFLPSARSIGMGGAATALSENYDALHFNTASSVYIDNPVFSFTHQILYQDMKYYYVSYITKLADNTTMGVNIKEFISPSIDKTLSVAGNIMQYRRAGTFEEQDLAIIWGIGQKLKNNFDIIGLEFLISVGGNVKYINSKIDDKEAQSYSTDWSVFIKNPDINVGLTVSNLFGKIKYYREEEDLPSSIRLGIGIPLEIKNIKTDFGIDLTKMSGNNLFVNTGVEVFLKNNLIVRAGFDSRNDAGSGISLGLGWTAPYKLKIINSLSLNYGYSSYGDLGDKHAFDVSMKF